MSKYCYIQFLANSFYSFLKYDTVTDTSHFLKEERNSVETDDIIHSIFSVFDWSSSIRCALMSLVPPKYDVGNTEQLGRQVVDFFFTSAVW